MYELLFQQSFKNLAWISKYGHIAVPLKAMPFGLCKVPATFEKIMNNLLHHVK